MPPSFKKSNTEIQVLLGRLVLVVVAVLYASSLVCSRFIYSVPDPPSPAELSVTIGWISVLTFLPLLLCGSKDKNKNKTDAAAAIAMTTMVDDYDESQNKEQDNSISSSSTRSTQMSLDESTTSPAINNNYSTIDSLEEEGNPVNRENNKDSDYSNNDETNWNNNKNNDTVQQQRNSYYKLLRGVNLAGMELAFYCFSSQALLNIGILTTPSARASFLVQTSVVLVPLLTYYCFGNRKERSNSVSKAVYFGCLSSLIGLLFLAHDKNSDDNDNGDNITSGSSIRLGIGDLLILIGTILWSIYIIRMGQIAHRYSSITLQGLKKLYMALFYTIWFLFTTTVKMEDDNSSSSSSSSVLWKGWMLNPICCLTILYTAIGPGSVADMLQQYGQKYVPATESTLLLSMGPIFTSIFGWFILHENVDGFEKIGAGFLIAGAMLASLSSSKS